ncbi:MAG: diacylglycerol kinase [Pseudomonadota bacterium]
MTQYTATGIKRLANAARYSWQGLLATFKHEEAFRQECLLFALALPCALWLGDTALERLLLVASIVVLMVVELLNSAIESVVDRVGEEHHALSGRAKDQGSAAVLLTVALVIATWLGVAIG